jgi:hypothetical protein
MGYKPSYNTEDHSENNSATENVKLSQGRLITVGRDARGTGIAVDHHTADPATPEAVWRQDPQWTKLEGEDSAGYFMKQRQFT